MPADTEERNWIVEGLHSASGEWVRLGRIGLKLKRDDMLQCLRHFQLGYIPEFRDGTEVRTCELGNVVGLCEVMFDRTKFDAFRMVH